MRYRRDFHTDRSFVSLALLLTGLLHQVRVIRSNIARLQTDHSAKMKEIEAAMFALHQDAATAAALAPSSNPTPASSASTSDSSASAPPSAAASSSSTAPASAANLRVAEDQALAPFLIVASIVDGSPSHRAGLRTGDHILRFGSLTRANWSTDALQQAWKPQIPQKSRENLLHNSCKDIK